jgi:hypothetical protein
VADIPVDGNTRVAFVPTIASLAAPTTTELNAGTLLTDKVTADGLVGFEPETADVDNSSLASTFDTKSIGRDQFSGTMLRLKKQTATDTVFNTLTRGTEGYIVIRRDIAFDTAWASTQPVEVYPIICGREKHLSPEANTMHRYEMPVKIRSAPELRAAVA